MQKLRNAIYNLVGSIARVGRAKIQPETLLVIRTDEIGDYTLWRNTLSCIRKSKRYQRYRITLLGNSAWRDLAVHFDHSNVDEFIWIDKKRFKSNMLYRIRFLANIRSRGFEQVVNTIFSRSPRVDDAIVAACSTSKKIGMARNGHNVAVYEKNYDQGLYHELHELPLTGLFEFTRNSLFTSMVLNEACAPPFGFQDIPEAGAGMKKEYAVIFPGSGRIERRWKKEGFLEAARFLHDQKGLEIVLAGGPAEMELAEELSSGLGFETVNLAGRTTLTEFVSLLAGARLLVSVDTGAVHLAAATGTKVYGLFNGDQYGRFAPYPDNILKGRFYTVYPDEFEKKPTI